MSTRNPDFLIIGGGVIGLNMAIAIKRHFSDQSVTLIEKGLKINRCGKLVIAQDESEIAGFKDPPCFFCRAFL